MAYDPDSRILSVWFVVSDKRYEFDNVPPETFAAFKAAFAKLFQRAHPESLPVPSGCGGKDAG
ncbi:KTSC domain-containing protein [Mesorhizobium sp. L48C026A00]|uniref:KTSC domain-containing protein n=1 Tax=Mesorhizobium sp. L48C026A00 TaxID=1287182 RepID=UPI0003D05BD2|nr:KTSC domain-containing protein [Mesorhizobium sp. L48C026A00]ESZ05752.1 hypothetical protein X737_35340 [Mesorhizobium sp. L48C026A00]